VTQLLQTISRWVLLLAVVAGMQSPVLVQGVFVLRSDYVATHLCEERHDPTSTCDGMCFLADRVAEAHGHADSAALHAPAYRVEITSVLPSAPAIPERPAAPLIRSSAPLLADAEGFPSSLLRPPRGQA
jgi:hypothetical protein